MLFITTTALDTGIATNLFGRVVGHRDDAVESDGVLEQPQVEEYGRSGVGAHVLEHFVVYVEQRHHAQGEQRHAHRHAVKIDDRVDGIPDQSVPDP